MKAENNTTLKLISKKGGGDNLSVAWKLPDGTKEIPIPSERLSFNTGNPALSVPGNNKTDQSLNVFPNPASGEIYITNPAGEGEINIMIYEITGRMVLQEKRAVTGNERLTLDVSTLDKGLYIIRLANSKSVYQGKVLIVR